MLRVIVASSTAGFVLIVVEIVKVHFVSQKTYK